MRNLKKLSFDNIRVTEDDNTLFGQRLNISVLDDKCECLAEAKCSVTYLKDFAPEWFYSEILEPEINYFFNEMLNDEERKIADNMSLDKYVNYINDKYGEDEASTLNELYKEHVNLNKYVSNNLLKQYNKCIRIDFINSNYGNTGAGTLIVDYLKENYELIFLYGIEEAEGYWLDKVNFKEIINGFMYWSKNEKLNKILG